jgi:glycosyltransferase involved in cell wall biosynthesis
MEILTIGYDAKRALNNSTGLGNYSRYVIDTMATFFPECRFNLYAKSKNTERIADILGKHGNVTLVPPKRRFMWRSIMLPVQLRKEVVPLYHGLSNEVPLTISRLGISSVVTAHDVIWRKFPSDYKAIDRQIYDYKYGQSMKTATSIIAISECTKRDIIDAYDIDADKITVIYQGCHEMFKHSTEAAQAAVMQKYGLPERYYVAVGTVQGRKNQLLAAQALPALPADVKLVIVGRRTSYAKQIDEFAARNGVTDRIIWLESIPVTDIPAIYSGAVFSTYTSRYEGFGIPVIESLSCQTPVIAATGSCLEEAGGKGAIYVDPDNVEQYVESARLIIDNPFQRSKLVSAGLQHVKKFNKVNFARDTMKVYEKTLKQFYKR